MEQFIVKKIFLIGLIVALGMFTGDNCMAKDVLNTKQKSIVMISSYVARGDVENLEKALNKGLDTGLTLNEIKEILVQMYAYCGFPRSLNALATFKKVVDARKDIVTGKEGKDLPFNTDKFAYGDKVQVELTGDHVKGDIMEFAPAIDKYLKEHLFADIFGRGVLTYKEREIATISALSSVQGVEAQLKAHIQMGKNTGLKDEQVNEILEMTKEAKSGAFAIGNKNEAYKQYFKGQSYLQALTTSGVNASNVTFEPACRNNWHIHHKGGQILLVTSGRGYYQQWGKSAQELKAGDVVNIEPGVKHWHGAQKDSWFSHVAIAVPADGAYTEWLEEVSDLDYNKLK